ncbi:hypothetical protein G3435_17680 [Pseudomonas sp. MAFF212428]|uniref:Uncharacterized protein n=1 Tax=Pseudomonas brassicae TaxID=2708063 RepID=A0A6B3NQU4_9PSED|nr:hypothetical protein [Pseudomonas brassicae]NER61298.1 hypothetical protein [Pseudomonas brassicae]NER64053.1 hypothetical protein [Pseudomonas brassicae]
MPVGVEIQLAIDVEQAAAGYNLDESADDTAKAEVTCSPSQSNGSIATDGKEPGNENSRPVQRHNKKQPDNDLEVFVSDDESLEETPVICRSRRAIARASALTPAETSNLLINLSFLF